MPILYDVIEQDITVNGTFADPFNAVAISVVITRPDSTTFTIGGFFHSVVGANSLFKFRYMAKAVGTFNWTATVTGGTPSTATTGSHSVTASTANKGHVKLHPTDTKSWVYDNGDPFHPIGYQGSFSPSANNDDVSTSMDLNDGTTNPGQFVFTNYFLPIYGNGKFNLLRFTVGNGTVDLKTALSSTVLTLSAENGRVGDALCQRARANGMAVMFVFLNGINGSGPASNTVVDTTAGARANTKKYIKYCVDRYGAYADIWELANEGQGTATTLINDEYLNDIAGEVELRDPYNHAISSSFEHNDQHSFDRDFTKADWFSPHSYLAGSSSLVAHTEIVTEVAGGNAVNKPLIIGEYGNRSNNWYTNHDTINRIRFWTLWINKTAAVVWSQSYDTTYANGGVGVANLYIGFGFRDFVLKLRNFIDTFPGGTTKSTPVIGTPSSAVQCYALSNGTTHYAAYLISTAQQTTAVANATIPINIPFAGNAIFTNPATGAQVGSTVAIAANTATNLPVPNFTVDIALKIVGSGGGDPPPPAPPPAGSVAIYGVIEKDVIVSGTYTNPQAAVSVVVTATPPTGSTQAAKTLGGFYYGASGASNTLFKFRFAANEVGTWNFSAAITANGVAQTTQTFSQSVVANAANKGFIVRKQDYVTGGDPKAWVFSSDGSPFNPIGCTEALFPRPGGLTTEPIVCGAETGTPVTGEDPSTRWLPLADYMALYGNGKMNIFRWSIGQPNHSMNQFTQLDATAFVPATAMNLKYDEVPPAVRAGAMRLMINPFHGPANVYTAPGSTYRANQEKYLKYCVDRWGAYVDFWEVANEAIGTATTGLNDEWVTAMRVAIRAADPHKHPVSHSFNYETNNADFRDIGALDFNNLHSYYTVDPLVQASTTVTKVAPGAVVDKQVILGEAGNSDFNSSPTSDLRARIQAWTLFFNKVGLMWWNHTYSSTYAPTNGAANLFIGAVMRGYIDKLTDYTDGFPSGTRSTPAVSGTGTATADCYAMQAANIFGAYLIGTGSHSVAKTSQITVNIPFAGNAVWTDPASGAVVGSSVAVPANTATALTAPSYTIDIALKILSGTAPPPDTTPPTVPGTPTFSNITPTGMRVSWAASTDNVGVTRYDLERATEATFASPIAFVLGNVLFYDATDLLSSKIYYWRVRARDAAVNISGYSTTGSQETSAPASSLTNYALASNGSIATATTVTVAGTPGAAINGDRTCSPSYPSGAWTGALPGILEVNFGQSRTISEINIIGLREPSPYSGTPTQTDVFTAYGNKNYTIDYWNGTAWINIVTITGNTNVWRQHTFAAITTTKIRANVTVGGTDPNAYIVELEALGAAGGTVNTTPNPPTLFVTDDAANTFDWTNSTTAGLVLADYEYTTDAGTTYLPVTAKPQPVGNVALAAGKVGVRVKAVAGRNVSTTLFSSQAFTVTTLAAPIAAFTRTPAIGTAPLSVTVTNTSTGGAAATHNWNWGDGTANSTVQSPAAHSYTVVGAYTITYTATNASGSSQATQTVTVNAPTATGRVVRTWDGTGDEG